MKFFTYVLVVVMAVSFVSCQRENTSGKSVAQSASYEVLLNEKSLPVIEAAKIEVAKMVDVVATLENQSEFNIPAFSSGPWAIAVKNLTTGYTYYYDSSNNFLGRKK